MNKPDQAGESDPVRLQELTSVTWVDDNGNKHERTIEDGKIVDREISQ